MWFKRLLTWLLVAALAVALLYLLSELFFEKPYLTANRRLTDVKLNAGLGEAKVLGNRGEHFQLPDIHIDTRCER